IDLGLAHPLAQRLRRYVHLRRDRADRLPLRVILPLALHHQRNRTFPHLTRVLRTPGHDPHPHSHEEPPSDPGRFIDVGGLFGCVVDVWWWADLPRYVLWINGGGGGPGMSRRVWRRLWARCRWWLSSAAAWTWPGSSTGLARYAVWRISVTGR